MKKERVKRVGDLIPGVIEGLGLDEKFEQERLRLDWERVVGEAIGKRSAPLYVMGRTLVIEVENSSWMNEIQFHRNEIVRKVNREFPKLKIREIRLQIERERERE